MVTKTDKELNEKYTLALGEWIKAACGRPHAICIGVGRYGCKILNELVNVDKLHGGKKGYGRQIIPFYIYASGWDKKVIDEKNIFSSGELQLGYLDNDVFFRGIGGDFIRGVESIKREGDRCVTWVTSRWKHFDSIQIPIDFIMILSGIGGGTGASIPFLAAKIKKALPDIPIITASMFPSKEEARYLLENTVLSWRLIRLLTRLGIINSIIVFGEEGRKAVYVVEILKRAMLIGKRDTTEILPFLRFLIEDRLIIPSFALKTPNLVFEEAKKRISNIISIPSIEIKTLIFLDGYSRKEKLMELESNLNNFRRKVEKYGGYPPIVLKNIIPPPPDAEGFPHVQACIMLAVNILEETMLPKEIQDVLSKGKQFLDEEIVIKTKEIMESILND